LEEERRLAYVGLTRARRRAKLYFASNRRIHGLWNATVPSRFIDELPPENVEVLDAPAGFGGSNYQQGGFGGYGRSRFDQGGFGGSTYSTPGWQRAQNQSFANPPQARRGPALIEGEVIAKSTGKASSFGEGDRVFHIKFGYGKIAAVDGNKLTVDFDKAGRKMVLESFVERG
jgi:DNA helicase-2/ATP-dependent DNA helicase PcrA